MFWLSKHDKALIKMYRGEQIIQYEKKIEFDKELQYCRIEINVTCTFKYLSIQVIQDKFL